jgi:hypothetical protein
VWNGYRLTVTCPCGVVFGRWVTSVDAESDLLAWATSTSVGMAGGSLADVSYRWSALSNWAALVERWLPYWSPCGTVPSQTYA